MRGSQVSEECSGQKSEKTPVSENAKEQRRFVTGLAPPSMPGHTGYITAASLPPRRSKQPPPTVEQE
uniref:Uncharacterized protein n=1 Tax=Timema genevievae TaxID=629358 RepID=A0A7R9JYZ4_TIMGE|nr:unnamed protein product [Timema genevievae]